MRFEAKLFVEYRWAGAGAAPPSARDIAREGVVRRAEELSRNRRLTECQRLHGELAVALLRWKPVEDTLVSSRAHCISVDAAPELVAAVAAREDSANHQVVLSWQHEQREHQAKRLQSLITDPLRATAWWFAANQDKPAELVQVATEFQQLRTILTHEEEADEDSAGHLVDEFLNAVDVADQLYLLQILRKLFGDHGRSDLVERIEPTTRSTSTGKDADSN
ncbi:hypothetical protein AB0I53_45515 [Saccharopolyspora sp. NPDC050389]|uniref:hypothetical protein n=1 Tax=Saccharopolyspora sp. NPDC050389 TaxID=3155516 RepID=UPI0033D8ACEA